MSDLIPLRVEEVAARAFEVQASIPPGAKGNANRYSMNVTMIVIAPDLENAVKAVLMQYPSAAIHNVNHKGSRLVLLVKE